MSMGQPIFIELLKIGQKIPIQLDSIPNKLTKIPLKVSHDLHVTNRSELEPLEKGQNGEFELFNNWIVKCSPF